MGQAQVASVGTRFYWYDGHCGGHLRLRCAWEPGGKHRGEVLDAETGLDYFGARYFSAAQGRFTTVDPMNHPSESQLGEHGFLAEPQRWNKYAYALNNPLRNIDPDGYETQATLDDKAVREAGQTIGDVIVGAGKGLWNALASTANLVNNFVNAESQAFTGRDLVATVPEAQYDNTTQAVAGIIAPLAVAAQQAVGEAGALQAARPAATQGSKVEGITNQIKAGAQDGSLGVKFNPKTPNQEGNVTITDNASGTKVNVRVETHPLPGSTSPVRHANVETVTPRTATTPKKVDNIHITQ